MFHFLRKKERGANFAPLNTAYTPVIFRIIPYFSCILPYSTVILPLLYLNFTSILMEISEAYLETAIRDLKAANLLYNKRFYQQSLFYFQQASEKSNKAYSIFAENYTPQELFNHRHDQLKVHKQLSEKQLKKYSSIKRDDGLKKVIGHLSMLTPEGINHYISYEENFRATLDRITNSKQLGRLDMGPKEIIETLDQFKVLKNFRFNLSKTQWRMFINVYLESRAKGFEELLKQYPFPSGQSELEKIRELEAKEYLTDEYIQLTMKSANNDLRVNKVKAIYRSMALLTHGLEHIRYPDPSDPEIFLKGFDQQIAFIYYQPDFMDYLSYAQGLHRKILKESSSS